MKSLDAKILDTACAICQTIAVQNHSPAMISLFLSQESREPDRDAVGPHELGAVRGLLARQRALRLGLLGPHRQGLGDGHQAVRPHILGALRPGTYIEPEQCF